MRTVWDLPPCAPSPIRSSMYSDIVVLQIPLLVAAYDFRGSVFEHELIATKNDAWKTGMKPCTVFPVVSALLNLSVRSGLRYTMLSCLRENNKCSFSTIVDRHGFEPNSRHSVFQPDSERRQPVLYQAICSRCLRT